MATNIIVARGGVEYVPPISLAFWRWLTVFIILFPFFFNEILKKKNQLNKEFWKLFFLGSMAIFAIVVDIPAIKGKAPQTPHPIAPKKKSFLNSCFIIFEFLINNE